jgi:hypothetical protein
MIGRRNPVPFQVGGGPSRIERAMRALERMQGDHGYSTDEDSIESLWRECRAAGHATIESFDERATLQYWPHTATDNVPVFEEMLGIDADPTEALEVRRQEIVPLYTATPEAWFSAISARLEEIDSRASLLTVPWVQGVTTQAGKLFEAFSPISGEQFDPLSSRKVSEYPNFSTAARATVLLDIGNGVAPSSEVIRISEQLVETLDRVLPSELEIRIIYATGFFLDSSLLDATGFGT